MLQITFSAYIELTEGKYSICMQYLFNKLSVVFMQVSYSCNGSDDDGFSVQN